MTKEAQTHKFSVITECERNSISFSELMNQPGVEWKMWVDRLYRWNGKKKSFYRNLRLL